MWFTGKFAARGADRHHDDPTPLGAHKGAASTGSHRKIAPMLKIRPPFGPRFVCSSAAKLFALRSDVTVTPIELF